jgi:hypothetical protein
VQPTVDDRHQVRERAARVDPDEDRTGPVTGLAAQDDDFSVVPPEAGLDSAFDSVLLADFVSLGPLPDVLSDWDPDRDSLLDSFLDSPLVPPLLEPPRA